MEHLQYNIPSESHIPTTDWKTSPTMLETSKNVVIKNNKIVANDTELAIRYGQKFKVKNVVASYAILADDFLVAVSNVGTARTITLPKPSLVGLGKYYIVKDASGSAATTTITVTPFATETIDGDTTNVINSNFGSKKYYTDATNWFTIL